MLSFQDIKKLYRSLFIHPLRSFLSSLGIIFGVLAVVTMLAIGEGAKQEALAHIASLGTSNLIIRQPLKPEEQRTKGEEKHSKGLSWLDVEAFQHHIPFLEYQVPLQVKDISKIFPLHHTTPEVLAVTREFADLKKLELAEGRFICSLDEKHQHAVCILGYLTAKNLGRKGHIGHVIELDDRPYEIVGILKPSSSLSSSHHAMMTRNLDHLLFIPLTKERHAHHSQLTEIILHLRDPSFISAAVPLVQSILNKNHQDQADYHLIIPQELLHQAEQTQRTFQFVLSSLAALSLLIGGIGIMNIMLATISERTREIGIRRAIGANQRHILVQFLSETLFLTFIGSILGIVAGVGVSYGISQMTGWPTLISIWSIFLSLAMSALVGVCSGLYPAMKAAQLDPIVALRHP